MIKKILKKIKTFFTPPLNFFSYAALRVIGFPISRLSYKNIHRLGMLIGYLSFFVLHKFRKRVFNNLAIANKLGNLSDKERTKICKASFQNLAITCLEFFRLKRKQGRLSGITIPYNDSQTEALLNKGQGIIFLIGHIANWELPFIEVTREHPGIAIGKPLKNPFLNRWILSVREMHKGKIVYPRNALSTGLKMLKQGHFVGIVGDQALPESSYSYPFLGVRAWTSPSAALLAYKTNSPIIVGTLFRKNYKYHVFHSDPIWPNLNVPLKEDVIRMMDQSMKILEEFIIQHPGQWLWQHDRWKQSGIDHVKKSYRHGFIMVIFPLEWSKEKAATCMSYFKNIYPRSFITFFAHPECMEPSQDYEAKGYCNPKELFIEDWRYQCIIDLSNTKGVEKHFKKLGAFKTISLKKMQKKAQKKQRLELLNENNLEELIKFSICK